MNESNEITQSVLDGLQNRLNTIMGYLRQLDPVNFKNQTTASKKLEVDRSNLSAALNADERYLRVDSALMQKIFLKYPEINKDWFESGKGVMLSSDANDIANHLTEHHLDFNLSDLRDVIVNKSLVLAQNQKLHDRDIKRLSKKIEEQTNQIKELKDLLKLVLNVNN